MKLARFVFVFLPLLRDSVIAKRPQSARGRASGDSSRLFVVSLTLSMTNMISLSSGGGDDEDDAGEKLEEFVSKTAKEFSFSFCYL